MFDQEYQAGYRAAVMEKLAGKLRLAQKGTHAVARKMLTRSGMPAPRKKAIGDIVRQLRQKSRRTPTYPHLPRTPADAVHKIPGTTAMRGDNIQGILADKILSGGRKYRMPIPGPGVTGQRQAVPYKDTIKDKIVKLLRSPKFQTGALLGGGAGGGIGAGYMATRRKSE